MSMPASLSHRGAHYQDAPPDKGCSSWPQCVSCPWLVCIPEFPAKERQEFTAALKVVRGYLAEPERTVD